MSYNRDFIAPFGAQQWLERHNALLIRIISQVFEDEKRKLTGPISPLDAHLLLNRIEHLVRHRITKGLY